LKLEQYQGLRSKLTQIASPGLLNHPNRCVSPAFVCDFSGQA